MAIPREMDGLAPTWAGDRKPELETRRNLPQQPKYLI